MLTLCLYLDELFLDDKAFDINKNYWRVIYNQFQKEFK